MSETAAQPVPTRTRRRPAIGFTEETVERYGLLAVWVLLAVVFSLIEPAFHTSATVQIIFGSQSTVLLVTLAVMVALYAGEFDLSVANVLAFSGGILTLLNVEHGVSIWLAVAIVLALAVLIGLTNSVLVVGVGVPSIVVTLGMGTLLAGLGIGIAGNQVRGGVTPGFVDLISAKWLGLPVAFYIGAVVALALYYLLEHTPVGRRLFFVGHSHDVARLAGIGVSRLRVASLVGSAFLAALGGVVLVGLTGASDPGAANSYLLPAFAAAFLGSTAIRPGQFNVIGSFIAVYFLVTGVTGLQLLGYTGWVSQVFYGGSLLIAVVLTRLVAKRRQAMRAR